MCDSMTSLSLWLLQLQADIRSSGQGCQLALQEAACAMLWPQVQIILGEHLAFGCLDTHVYAHTHGDLRDKQPEENKTSLLIYCLAINVHR